MSREGVVYFIHSDHLGSTSLTTDQNGAAYAETRYTPFGAQACPTASNVGPLSTRSRRTSGSYPFGAQAGQRAERGFGLMDYQARYYDARLGRFVSADTVEPDYENPQALNRYSYVLGKPIVYLDPSGHQG